MSKTCTHVAIDTRDKPTYRSRRIHWKQVCHVCGWVREYSLPVDAGRIWMYTEWRSPDSSEKPTRSIDDQ